MKGCAVCKPLLLIPRGPRRGWQPAEFCNRHRCAVMIDTYHRGPRGERVPETRRCMLSATVNGICMRHARAISRRNQAAIAAGSS